MADSSLRYNSRILKLLGNLIIKTQAHLNRKRKKGTLSGISASSFSFTNLILLWAKCQGHKDLTGGMIPPGMFVSVIILYLTLFSQRF